MLDLRDCPSLQHGALQDILEDINNGKFMKTYALLLLFVCLLLTLPVHSQQKTDTSHLKVGGEVRFQYFNYRNEAWGEIPTNKDGFILSRYLLHMDADIHKNIRGFVQLQSSMASNRMDPSPVDENLLDLHQAYLDIGLTPDRQNLTFRIGRQELSYGSQRLISVREIPNNRQSFDAARLQYTHGKLHAEGFYGYYVAARKGTFNDRLLNPQSKLWGIYTVWSDLKFLKNLDFYYFGLNKLSTRYQGIQGAENRHSIGGRVWHQSPYRGYDIEAVFQFGDFAGRRIRAWTLSSNTYLRLAKLTSSPTLGLKTEWISGDRNRNDSQINTFNALYPKGAYFGLAALIGPYNLFDIHPYFSIRLGSKIEWQTDYDLFYRASKADGIYEVNGSLIYDGNPSQSAFIGGQLGTSFDYKPSQKLLLRIEFTWFDSGAFLKAAGPGKDILMFGSTVQYKF